jgi:acetylglutamate kinase
MDRMTHLKQSLPYIQKHTGSTFVIKLGGRVLNDEDTLYSLAEDLSLLHNVGIHVILVHGGGPQMNALASEMGIEQKVVGGRRVTDKETLRLAQMVFRGTLNTRFVSVLKEAGTPAVGLSGLDGGLIEAVKRPEVNGIDFGFVGDIVKVNSKVLSALTQSGFIPVVCSLGATQDGQVLNINADTIAEKIALELQAKKLFLLTDQTGLFANPQDPDSLISYTDVADVKRLIKTGVIQGGMKPKIESTLRALEGGVERVHLINAFDPSSLLCEVFTNEGCGTLIVKDQHHLDF